MHLLSLRPFLFLITLWLMTKSEIMTDFVYEEALKSSVDFLLVGGIINVQPEAI